jgi:PAS domain S-box-containing protein
MSVSQGLARTANDHAVLCSLAVLYDRSLDAVLIAEAATPGPTVMHVNAAFTTLSGFSAGDLVGGSCAWLEPEGSGAPEQAIRAALIEGRPAQAEFAVRRKDASQCWIEINVLPVVQSGDPACGFIITARDVSARREGERARRLAEAQFRDAVDNINEGLAIFDADDRLVICNKRFLQTVPHLRALGELQGRTYEELVRYAATHGNMLDQDMKRDPERWIALRLEQHRAASGTPYLRRLPDGRWLQATEQRSSDGGVVTVLTDITPAKQAETRLSDAIESIDAVFTLWDDEARLLMWNKRFPDAWPDLADLLVPGVTQRALIERNIDRGALQVPAEARERYVQDRIEMHRTPASEVELKRADGRVFLIRAHRTAEGGQVRLETDITDLKQRERELSIAKDIAEAANQAAVAEIGAHKRVAEALGRSQRHLKHAQRIAATGSVERDLVTGVSVWSDELYRILGVGRDFPPTFGNFLGLVHQDDRAKLAASMREVADLKPGMQVRPDEYRIVRPDGDIRVIQPVWEAMFDDRSSATHLFAALKDVTELRAAEVRRCEMEQQLQHSQKLEALGTLAGGVAHELNNTLVPILALTKITANRCAEGSRELANLNTVLRASERARDLVQQILAFSRKETPTRQRLDAAALVREALKMLRASLPSTIHIAETIGAAPPVLADPSQLYQIVTNLLTNAAQAIGGGIGRIAVEVGAASGGGIDQTSLAVPAAFRLAVSDTGCGMDGATQRRIFEPFFTTKPVGEGTGLGLAVVHGIVADHGGRIAVTSEAGRGTCVEVFLPAAAD